MGRSEGENSNRLRVHSHDNFPYTYPMFRRAKTSLTAAIPLLLIVALGAFFRLQGLQWDAGMHLHPDERFLAMVANDIKLPSTFFEYLDPATSRLNPRNVKYEFFVYGIFPVTIVKTVASALSLDEYGKLVFVGRTMMGLLDVLVIVLVYKMMQLFTKLYAWSKTTPYWAAFAYATLVLPIQLSHFFTSDPVVTFCVTLSLYLGFAYVAKPNKWLIIVAGIAFGIAMGSKINTLLVFPSVVVLFTSLDTGIEYLKHRQWRKIPWYCITAIQRVLLFVLCAYLTMRLTDPYLFASRSLLNPAINAEFLSNIAQLKLLEKPDAQFPPAIQWITTKPILFPLRSLILWGIGMPATVFAAIGLLVIHSSRKKLTKYPQIVLAFFGLLAMFLYQGSQFAKAMRYFYLLYPVIAIFIGLGAHFVYSHVAKVAKAQFAKTALVLTALTLVAWPLLFSAIYYKPHSRITASEWLQSSLPPNAIVLAEHWDDALPLSGTKPYREDITMLELPVFDPDTAAKEAQFAELLEQANVIVLSSNRGWGSMPTVPDRYPFMTRWYQQLFANRSEYRKVAEFTSYPSLDYLGIPVTISDDASEEFFTVYDHPKVMVFMKRSSYPAKAAQ